MYDNNFQLNITQSLAGQTNGIDLQMGAAVTIELNKPTDASDVRATRSLQIAKNEVIRLREELGHLAHLGNYNTSKG